MKKASIISIGNEVLAGLTVDTNLAFLGSSLQRANVPVVSAYTIGDDLAAIIRMLSAASADADIIMTTGGLGPTDDDLTRQALAEFLDRPLEFQPQLLEVIQAFFTRLNRRMSQKNENQAYIPAGAQSIKNERGTAPGIAAQKDDKLYFALPGVPAEMKPMFEHTVLPEILKVTSGQVISTRKLHCFGAGESDIAEKLGSFMQRGRNPLINCTAHFGQVTLHIIATASTDNQAMDMLNKDEKALRDILGDIIFGVDDQTLAEVAGRKLAEQNKTIALAESCTGGLVAKMLTDVPGASGYFHYGWITYSNNAKISQLNVPAELLEKHGAVSAEVSAAMAKGAKNIAGADYAIGITGIAGPTGATEQKPLGLVYISVDGPDNCITERYLFAYERKFMRLRTAQTALNMLRNAIR